MAAFRQRSGVFVVLGLLGLGGLMYFGLAVALRSMNNVPDVPTGIPAGGVRLAACDFDGDSAAARTAADAIAAANAEFVLVQGIGPENIDATARRLGMNGDNPPPFSVSENAEAGGLNWGNTIFSRQTIFDGRAIPNSGGGSMGVWGWVVEGGHRFMLASVELSGGPGPLADIARRDEMKHFRAAWSALAQPPLLAAFAHVPGADADALARAADSFPELHIESHAVASATSMLTLSATASQPATAPGAPDVIGWTAPWSGATAGHVSSNVVRFDLR